MNNHYKWFSQEHALHEGTPTLAKGPELTPAEREELVKRQNHFFTAVPGTYRPVSEQATPVKALDVFFNQQIE